MFNVIIHIVKTKTVFSKEIFEMDKLIYHLHVIKIMNNFINHDFANCSAS